MKDNPYADIPGSELILRDHLAVARTVLANERTLLAYVRTALSFILGGAFFVKFSETLGMQAIGWAFVPVGLGVLVLGSMRFRRTRAHIQNVGNNGTLLQRVMLGVEPEKQKRS